MRLFLAAAITSLLLAACGTGSESEQGQTEPDATVDQVGTQFQGGGQTPSLRGMHRRGPGRCRATKCF